MATEQDGLFLQQFVEPQLLEDFRNYRDDFLGVLKKPNPGAIDKDGIRFNKLVNNVGFKVNATVDFEPLAMPGKKTLVEWDKLDTTPTSYTDAELRAMAFDKESALRVEHTNSFRIGVRDYVLNKLAPTSNVDNKMPVIRTTGATYNGRKRLTYEDLINFYERLDPLNLADNKGFHMILSEQHRSDIIADRAATSNYRDVEIDKETGELKRFFKLNFFENNSTPVYNAAGTLKSIGAVAAAGDQRASVFIYAPNTVYHIESVQVLFTAMKNDVISPDPKAMMRLHTYGLCDKKQNHGFGAIISGNPA